MGKKIIELWITGYSCTGESAPARLLGRYIAGSFTEAIDLYREGSGDKVEYNPNNGKYQIWGCSIYDNETEARIKFG